MSKVQYVPNSPAAMKRHGLRVAIGQSACRSCVPHLTQPNSGSRSTGYVTVLSRWPGIASKARVSLSGMVTSALRMDPPDRLASDHSQPSLRSPFLSLPLPLPLPLTSHSHLPLPWALIFSLYLRPPLLSYHHLDPLLFSPTFPSIYFVFTRDLQVVEAYGV